RRGWRARGLAGRPRATTRGHLRGGVDTRAVPALRDGRGGATAALCRIPAARAARRSPLGRRDVVAPAAIRRDGAPRRPPAPPRYVPRRGDAARSGGGHAARAREPR